MKSIYIGKQELNCVSFKSLLTLQKRKGIGNSALELGDKENDPSQSGQENARVGRKPKLTECLNNLKSFQQITDRQNEQMELESQLISAFKLERTSLKNAIQTYKEQIDCVEKSKVKAEKELLKVKTVLKGKAEMLVEQGKELSRLKKKLEKYENILPQLDEMDSLQKSLIQENQELKGRQKVTQALLGNIASLVRTGQHNEYVMGMVRSLTQPFACLQRNNSKHRL